MFRHFDRKAVVALTIFMGVSAGVGFWPADSAAASGSASTYPDHPVTLTVPVAPGGVTDINARLLADKLTQILRQSFIVENRPGASGSIGAYAVSRAKPDGYTLLFQYNAYHVITPQMTAKPSWHPLKDFIPVANVSSNPQVIVVRADLPIRSFKELIAYGKEHPGKLNYASAGKGSMHHVSAELLQQITNTKFTHIPFSGSGPAVNNLLGGVVDFALPGPSSVIQHIQSGKLRALAVTSEKRIPSLPDVPTTLELGFPGLISTASSAIYAPVGTPESVIAKLASAIKEVSAAEDYRTKLESLGVTAQFMGPVELGNYTVAEFNQWQEVLKAANIQAD